MTLYIIGQSFHSSREEQPKYELWATDDNTSKLIYLGAGARIAVELLKRFCEFGSANTVEVQDVNKDAFVKIIESAGYKMET